MTKHTPTLIVPKDGSFDEAIKERSALNLAFTHFDHVVGRIRVLGSWWLHDQKSFEPCLVLIPAHRQIAPTKFKADRVIPCVVLLMDAWRWDLQRGGDPKHVGEQLAEFAPALGMNGARKEDLHAIIGAVEERLDDLVKIPPAPPMNRVLTGDVRVTLSDGRVIERETFRNE